jgi:hypothetical protein
MMAYRPSPETIARWVCQPDFLQDTNIRPGETYLMDRFGYLPDQGDMDIELRTRSDTEILGTANTRQIPNQKIPILLREITGPGSGDPLTPGLAGNFRFSIPAMRKQQRILWDAGHAQPLIAPQFHSSVGSDTLLMDYRLTMDRFYIRALGNTPNKWNPGGVADGGTYAVGPQKISVNDLDYLLEWLVTNKCPPMDDGLYHYLLHPRMWNHFRQDTRFREQLTAASWFPISLIMGMQDEPFGGGMMPPANPNAMILPNYDSVNQPSLGGSYPYLGQKMPGCDDKMMPGGFVYNQFRFFVSNNIPTKQVQLTYTASTPGSGEPTGSAFRTAFPGMAFGKHAIGEIFGGDPVNGIPVQILRNTNDDYSRFLIVVWQAFMGLARLNDDFVIEARTYGL